MSMAAHTFDLYAAYYDLLYGDKDYAAEAAHVAGLLPAGTREVLELGCGTGGHALALARLGLRVQGVDLSPEMVARAQARRAGLAPELQARLAFAQGDLRSYRAGCEFDAVISLFHVMSYQTTNQDLLAGLRTARTHLREGGLFVFDFWYGPAVLSDRPRQVVKTVADARIEVRRETTPAVHVNDNRVDVRFDVHIRAREGGAEKRLHEVHPMRYLFLPELDALFAQTGFERVDARAWMDDRLPDDRSWYASVSARAC
ncbi:SAM-dependent methyltransferase [Rubrivivax sp. A210]|uniref:class I SAM-dependent DNA methyltransferase n=1 Tax=Rubrivivax sp. A210 TaxID=2772301 RepID=UPI00191937E4|nr:class I SAM-dependent methyltransferase [Rubrivivax sp. A210]CAD5372628.1 SAM-dependent methyltransferase [Rubrivivax sp. A210]